MVILKSLLTSFMKSLSTIRVRKMFVPMDRHTILTHTNVTSLPLSILSPHKVQLDEMKFLHVIHNSPHPRSQYLKRHVCH